MTTDRFPRRHPDTAFRAIGDEGGMVVLPTRAEVKVLNPVGIKVFSLLDGEHSTDAIVREIVEEFDVSEQEAADHVNAFLDQLTANGMLEEPEAAVREGGEG